MKYFKLFLSILLKFIQIFQIWKYFDLFVYTNKYCVGAGISALVSIFAGLGPYNFRRKMEKARPMTEVMDGKVFVCHQSWHFIFVVDLIKMLFPIRTLTWRVNNSVSPRERSKWEKRKYYYLVEYFSTLLIS